MTESLHHVNAALNLTATLLLILGFVFIKQKREALHKNTMLATFGVSVLFLCSYLTRMATQGGHTFDIDHYGAPIAYCYYILLATHVLLAMIVPFLALRTIWLGLSGKREQHRRLARWTFPIWLYVSVTGVLVYLVLYWWFPAQTETVRLMTDPLTNFQFTLRG